MYFFMKMVPPTSTGQMRKFRVVGGKVQGYKPEKVRHAEEVLTRHLKRHAPEQPFEGPVQLAVQWQFYSKSHKPMTWRTTRPDTDNLQKLLKDCMTRLGYWKDDSQVVKESVTKAWVPEGSQGIFIAVGEQVTEPVDWCGACEDRKEGNE